jgi:hypothetical protein
MSNAKTVQGKVEDFLRNNTHFASPGQIAVAEGLPEDQVRFCLESTLLPERKVIREKDGYKPNRKHHSFF